MALSKFLGLVAAYACFAFSTTATYAQVDADPLPGDPKLVVFQFDENNSFRVFTRPLASTHIQLEADERVKVLAMGDTVGWITAQKDNNVFIKPRFPNINTPATLITNKRTYQFVFRSTTENGRWYQRVSFQNPSAMLIEVNEEARQQLAVAANTSTQTAETSQASVSGGQVSVDQLNFNYDISGDELIKPINVFDDGISTFIQVRSPEDVPAVFRLVDKDIELVEYVLRGKNTIVIPRVLEAGLLKLGKLEARFYNRTRVSKGIFGSYKFDGGTK